MSDLFFKDDWNDVSEQWKSWWKDKTLTEGIVGIHAHRNKPLDVKPWTPSKNIDNDWLDFNQLILKTEKRFSETLYLGVLIPEQSALLGPGSFSVYLGSTPKFAEDTVWFEPCFDDITSANIEWKPNNPWWQWTLETTKKLVEYAKGRFIVSVPDLVENTDTLAAMLDTQKFLSYLLDEPDEVHRLQKQLLPIWQKVYDELYNIVKYEDGSSSFTAFSIFAPGSLAKLQCDMSAMISPRMYEEFVLPYMSKQTEMLDYSHYHLDGPGAVCHLDHVLSMEKLDCLQWTAGAGNPDGGDPCWDFIYKKALDKGKKLQVLMHGKDLPQFLKRMGKKGMFITVWTDSEDEAVQLMLESEKYR